VRIARLRRGGSYPRAQPVGNCHGLTLEVQPPP